MVDICQYYQLRGDDLRPSGGAVLCGEHTTEYVGLQAQVPHPDAGASSLTTAHVQLAVTGEEDEEAAAELKGAKVFIKRGERDFCEGILGTVKLLKHKETGHERIRASSSPPLVPS